MTISPQRWVRTCGGGGDLKFESKTLPVTKVDESTAHVSVVCMSLANPSGCYLEIKAC